MKIKWILSVFSFVILPGPALRAADSNAVLIRDVVVYPVTSAPSSMEPCSS